MRRPIPILIPILILVLLLGILSWGAARTFAPAPTPAAALLPTGTPAASATALLPTPALPTNTPPIQPQPTDEPLPTLTVLAQPAEHYIRNISGHKQYFPLGCEAAAAKDWANYFGKDFNEFEFQHKLPLSDNPDLGFVGDVQSPWGQVPPYGYGVHAGPIAALLNEYDIPAKAYRNYSLEQIKAKIAQDKPVIAWVIGNVVGGVPYEYTDSQGNKVIVAAYEHVVIVTGYNEEKVRYMNNGKFYETPNEVFLNSWGVLGNMVVVDE
jgi:uncharacterized protein YvpB